MMEETKKKGETDVACMVSCGTYWRLLAVIAVYMIAQRRQEIGMANMIWSIVGSVLMVPTVGILAAIIAYMAVTG